MSPYIYASVVIILIIILIIQAQYALIEKRIESDKKYGVMIQTKKGLIRIDNDRLAKELTTISSKLNKRKNNIRSEVVPGEPNSTLLPLIEQSIQNLSDFIARNPSNEKSLCSLESRAYILSSIPENEPDFKTHVEWEEQDSIQGETPRERLIYLIRNLDVVIRMLRGKVCDRGRIDIDKLHSILIALDNDLMDNGVSHDITNDNIMPFIYEMGERSNEPMIMYNHHKEESYENIVRGIPGPEDLQNSIYCPNKTICSSSNWRNSQLLDESNDHLITRLTLCGGLSPSDEELLNGNQEISGSAEDSIDSIRESLKYFSALDGDATEMLDCIGHGCDDSRNADRWYQDMATAFS